MSPDEVSPSVQIAIPLSALVPKVLSVPWPPPSVENFKLITGQ